MKPMSNTGAWNNIALPRIAVTSGDPAGVGPDLVLEMADDELPCRLVTIGDPGILVTRARELGHDCQIETVMDIQSARPHQRGCVQVLPVSCPANVTAGSPSVDASPYVLGCIESAVTACMNHHCDGMVTGPVNKALINDFGVPFSGHTEFIAARFGARRPVMLLASAEFRVALVTTHVPLVEVPRLITANAVRETCEILLADLKQRFGIESPRIAVCGLNPHAGESGHLGSEEQAVIVPVIQALQQAGHQVTGPLPADTAFTPANRTMFDAIVAMYHDQGLAALKAIGFGNAANITLGLPIIRTSVDHGTAYDLAASGKVDAGSMRSALFEAIALCNRQSTRH